MRALEDPEDRAATRTIVIDAVVDDGLRTARELEDRLGSMSRDERRALARTLSIEAAPPVRIATFEC